MVGTGGRTGRDPAPDIPYRNVIDRWRRPCKLNGPRPALDSPSENTMPTSVNAIDFALRGVEGVMGNLKKDHVLGSGAAALGAG